MLPLRRPMLIVMNHRHLFLLPPSLHVWTPLCYQHVRRPHASPRAHHAKRTLFALTTRTAAAPGAASCPTTPPLLPSVAVFMSDGLAPSGPIPTFELLPLAFVAVPAPQPMAVLPDPDDEEEQSPSRRPTHRDALPKLPDGMDMYSSHCRSASPSPPPPPPPYARPARLSNSASRDAAAPAEEDEEE